MASRTDTQRPNCGAVFRRCAFLAASAVAVATAGQGQDEPPRQASEAESKARAFLNELSTRRRVTTLFENRQSAFHGVQENFVNTSAGNSPSWSATWCRFT